MMARSVMTPMLLVMVVVSFITTPSQIRTLNVISGIMRVWPKVVIREGRYTGMTIENRKPESISSQIYSKPGLRVSPGATAEHDNE